MDCRDCRCRLCGRVWHFAGKAQENGQLAVAQLFFN
jgi:hypothetical protein